MTPDRGTGAAWYRRFDRLESGLWLVEAIESDRHPDGTVTDDVETDGAPVLWRTEPSDSGLLSLHVPLDAVGGVPPLWFTFVDEPKAAPAAANLVAFATPTFPAGTVVSGYAFATAGVPNDAQVGAVRWYRDGRIHQIFVAPDHRRQNVGTALLYAASAWHQANGWSGKLHADGRRTELGQRFAAGVRHPSRLQPLSETMPPMDPA
jgi:GNAT superfamily N-acetyltransferase